MLDRRFEQFVASGSNASNSWLHEDVGLHADALQLATIGKAHFLTRETDEQIAGTLENLRDKNRHQPAKWEYSASTPKETATASAVPGIVLKPALRGYPGEYRSIEPHVAGASIHNQLILYGEGRLSEKPIISGVWEMDCVGVFV